MGTKFVNVKEGELTLRDEKTMVETPAEYISGVLTLISLKEREIKGSKQSFWYVKLKGEDCNYLWCLPYSSGVFKSIILCLAGDKEFNKDSVIKIKPYAKEGYTKAIVYNGERKLDWVTKDLPPIEEVKVGRNIVRDDTKRMEFITELVEKIREIIK